MTVQQLFEMITNHGAVMTADWAVIRQTLIDLPYSDAGFLVLASIENPQHYIQTCVNKDEYQTLGLYSVEFRIPTETSFTHYQRTTNDAVQVVRDFAQFHQGQSPNVSLYTDITQDFLT